MSLETKSSAMNPESLLQIPLIKAALEDLHFKKIYRGVDQSWKDEGIIAISVGGFNPYESAGYIARKSALSRWLRNPNQSARSHNSADALMKQALFLAHDYLHAWAISTIRELAQADFSFGADTVHQGNIEDYVFCHLLTEAVATVGLDYWFLSQVKLGEICPVGTRVRCLTIGYHRDYDDELRRFNPTLKIYRPDFFSLLSRFYCDGIFPGFTIKDLDQSPILMNWIDHEVFYGEKQREYARLWFSYLSREGPSGLRKKPDAPVLLKKEWQKNLISKLGQALWQNVHSPLPIARSFDSSRLWRYADARAPDPRFSNLLHFDLKTMLKSASQGAHQEEKETYLAYQFVSQHDFKKCPLKIQSQVPELVKKRDFRSLERVFRKLPKIAVSRDEPKHLLILN